MELTVLIGGAAEMAHDFWTHGTLRWDHETDVVLKGFFEQKPAGLSVLLGKRGELLIEMHIHLQTDLLSERFRHREFPYEKQFTWRRGKSPENSRIVYRTLESTSFIYSNEKVPQPKERFICSPG
jgi:hypothetical protein